MILQIQPWIDEAELVELKRVVDSTFVTENELTKEFELMTKDLTNSKNVLAFANGTLALYTALKVLGIGEGDEVIVPDMTFIATANSVIMAGATPVFCDIDENTFCLDVLRAEELINEKTKAIMPVHLYGQSADMEKILVLAKKKNLFIIEDAAQGVGVKFNDKHVGTFGDLGILSYYGNKTITCGEGGIILTENDDLAKKCYRLKNHGRDKKGIFYHEHIGFNFSFTEMQAAIGIAQMKKFDRIVQKKASIHERYLSELNNIHDFTPAYIDPRTSPIYWFTSFLAEDLENFVKYMTEKGIQTRRFFYPLHKQPCYKGVIEPRQELSVSSKVFDKGISLPSSYQLTEAEQTYVIETIKGFYLK